MSKEDRRQSLSEGSTARKVLLDRWLRGEIKNNDLNRKRNRCELISIEPRGTRVPIHMIHPIEGGVMCYRLLSAYLGPDQPVYALQQVVTQCSRQPYLSVSEMADEYLAEIVVKQDRPPYNISGYSFGGVVALEVAQRM